MSDTKPAAVAMSPALRRVRFKAYLGGASWRLAQLRDSNAALSPQLPADGATISRALARHGHSAQPGLKVPLLALQEVLAFVPSPAAEALDAGRALQGRGVGAAPTTLGKIVQTSALALHLVVENEASVKPVSTPLCPKPVVPEPPRPAVTVADDALDRRSARLARAERRAERAERPEEDASIDRALAQLAETQRIAESVNVMCELESERCLLDCLDASAFKKKKGWFE